MVPAAGCYDSHLLPLGAGTYDGSAEKRNTAINDRDLCGVTGAETGIMQRCATLHIGSASLDIYPGCDAEQLRLMVKLLRLC